MQMSYLLMVFPLLLGFTNCSGDRDKNVPPADEALVEAGKAVFNDHCSACHQTKTTGIAPGLGGLLGRPAGSVDFPYSAALKSADFTWDPDRLNEFLKAPRAYLPGNQMAFYGLEDEDLRKALIAFIGSI